MAAAAAAMLLPENVMSVPPSRTRCSFGALLERLGTASRVPGHSRRPLPISPSIARPGRPILVEPARQDLGTLRQARRDLWKTEPRAGCCDPAHRAGFSLYCWFEVERLIATGGSTAGAGLSKT
jgi:hypothetical protein